MHVQSEMYFKILTVIIVYMSLPIGYSKKLPLPDFIRKCSSSAPDFDECSLQSGRDAIPHILNGFKQYDFPNLSPLVIPFASLSSSQDFSLNLTNLNIHGWDAADLKKFRFDLKNKKVHAQVDTQKLELLGKYEIDGKILVVPIQGKGDINITTVGLTIEFDADYTLEEVDGEQYIKIEKSTTGIPLKRAYFNLTNLFGGNKELGETTVKFLNDDWEQVLDTLKPAITEIVSSVVNRFINGVAKHVPVKELFLD